jgi:preprotein translocase subunit YajC
MSKKPVKKKATKTMTDQTNIEAVAAPRTLAQKLAAAELLVAKYRQQINAEKQINNVQVGDEVTFNFGRAAKLRVLAGTITAVADTDLGRMVAIQTGEGLDVEIKKVRAADIVTNSTAATRDGEAPASGDAAPFENVEGAEGGDPLASE